MADLDLENIDTVKAFFTIVLGAAVGAFLFYLYATILRPRLVQTVAVSAPTAYPAVTSGAQ